jgi:hypothetical protein
MQLYASPPRITIQPVVPPTDSVKSCKSCPLKLVLRRDRPVHV